MTVYVSTLENIIRVAAHAQLLVKYTEVIIISPCLKGCFYPIQPYKGWGYRR